GRDCPSAMHQTSFLYQVFRESGSITLWNPFIGWGEPMIENLASQALSPLLIYPVFWFGPVQGGKVALIIAILMMGWGGWLIGRVLRLGWGGRLLAGALVAGSGSIVTQFGHGFVHLAFGQVYVPYVVAGLIGTLYLQKRWCVVMLALAAALMPFTGALWYALPMALVALVVVPFALIQRDPQRKQFFIDIPMLQRVVLAGVFAVGLYAIKILSIQKWLVYHPNNWANPGSTFLEIINTYVAPYTPKPDFDDQWINYHYVIPLLFVIGLLIVRALIVHPADDSRRGIWRVIVPSAFMIFVLTFWAQGDIQAVRDIYQLIPALEDWKNSGRVGAAATPLIIMIAAIWFDDVVVVLSRWARGLRLDPATLLPIARLKARLALPPSLARGTLVVATAAMLLASLDVMANWERLVYRSYINEYARDEQLGMDFLRTLRPNQMLSTLTQGWITHFSFVNNLGRTTHGDATIFTMGMPSTIGFDSSMTISPEYAVGANLSYVGWLTANGYIPIANAPDYNGTPTLWYNPESPPYAFWIERWKLTDRSWEVVRRGDVTPITYFHHMDSIDLFIDGAYPPNSVVVALETAHPGWFVEVNGQRAQLESIGGRLGVLLPNGRAPGGGTPTHIRFYYAPTGLVIGGVILILTAFACIVYLLKVERRIPLSLKQRMAATAATVGSKVYTVLTTPDVLNFDPDKPPLPMLPAPKTPALPAPRDPHIEIMDAPEASTLNAVESRAANGNGAKAPAEVVDAADSPEGQ
ncbi:MAG TPA: hypothetical protein PLD47_07890, partial [Aggregatilineales bacterium]|nr:hypothetical protein [Aggregatilineales bacterium]